jgi:hypothetical protein
MKTKRCMGCGAVIHAYRQACPHCKKDLRPLYSQHPILTGMVIANIGVFLVFMFTSVQNTSFFVSSGNSLATDSGSLETAPPGAEEDTGGFVAGLFSGRNEPEELKPYEIVKEEDSSYPGCKRKVYKIIIDNRVPRSDIETILENLYEEKKRGTDKVFIYAYAESEANNIDKAKYKARLFMEPSCEMGNQYAIDYAF